MNGQFISIKPEKRGMPRYHKDVSETMKHFWYGNSTWYGSSECYQILFQHLGMPMPWKEQALEIALCATLVTELQVKETPMQPSTLLLLWMLLLFSSGKMNVLENTYIFHSRLTSFPSYLFKTFDNVDKKKPFFWLSFSTGWSNANIDFRKHSCHLSENNLLSWEFHIFVHTDCPVEMKVIRKIKSFASGMMAVLHRQHCFSIN